MNFQPTHWSLNEELVLTAEVEDSDLLYLISKRFNVNAYILGKFSPGYCFEWDKETGEVEFQEDISYHGSSVWDVYKKITLSPEENQFLIALERIMNK